MSEVNSSILEIIQEKERELALREAEAKEAAIVFLQQAELAAEGFLREQTLLARDEASKLYERRAAEIQRGKEQLLISQEQCLQEMKKNFQDRFGIAVDQVIQWIWDMEEDSCSCSCSIDLSNKSASTSNSTSTSREPQPETTEAEAVSKAYK